MALHTKVDGEGPDGQYLSVSPLFAPEGESTTVPKHRMPDGPMSGRDGLRDHPRRAHARRQRPPEPRDVRNDVDGASGREADGRDASTRT